MPRGGSGAADFGGRALPPRFTLAARERSGIIAGLGFLAKWVSCFGGNGPIGWFASDRPHASSGSASALPVSRPPLAQTDRATAF
ncbi:hypothetical protein BGLA2_810036 [Burkholderia gladioli]|nr:hypothetical protein BGLA2_810036 [Burkholderia gladioli]